MDHRDPDRRLFIRGLVWAGLGLGASVSCQTRSGNGSSGSDESSPEIEKQVTNDDATLVLDVDADVLARHGDLVPTFKLITTILMGAVQKGASDVYFESGSKTLRFRYRIDDVDYDVLEPPMKFRDAILSGIKLVARLDIAEKRLPQEGRVNARFSDKGVTTEVIFLVSCQPTPNGEHVTIRVRTTGRA